MSGIRGADLQCYRQSQEAGLYGTFRAFLSAPTQNLVSIVKRTDRTLPIINLKGQLLAKSWSSLFEGQSGAALRGPIYSFNGRSILTDPLCVSHYIPPPTANGQPQRPPFRSSIGRRERRPCVQPLAAAAALELSQSPSPLRPADENARVNKSDGPKKLSVEHIYQKKTQLEHILLRPDTYIGSVELVTQQMWVYDEGIGLNCRDVTFVPGLYKIFDEILVNAADNKQRDKNMSCIKITIDVENNTISVWNNGKGIPVVEHKVEKVYVPALIFGQLLTSSNYDDNEKKVTGGRNGYGAKLCNIFSTKFTVETGCHEYKKLFKQTWTDNMGKAGEMKLKYFDGDDYTCVTFQPDLAKFKMTILDKDIVALMSRRAYDIAGSTKDVKVFLNGQRLPVKGFRSYVDLYLKDKVDETGNALKVIHEEVNSRWEVCLTLSEKGFQQVSFVNSIATTKGGRHVDYVADQLVTKLIDVVKKKNKNGVGVKPFQVKNHMWIFVNALIENPTFDSQTKENMTLQAKNFGSTCKLSEKFIKGAVGCGIVESILNWVKFKAQNQLNKKCSAVKHSKIKGVPKLDDANDAGSKNSLDCTLILTEGDSAKTLAVSGLGVVGRDKYGVFPLRGKILNVREASHKQIMENAEINNIIKIVGLQYKKNYEDQESLKTLRYGKIMIMTDQDQDGSHIKGLLINFIHHNWPSLLRHNFLEEFITPIIKASKNKEEIAFYSIPEFEEWKSSTQNYNSWKIKYYKGLGTSTSKEAKEYFADMAKHRIGFKYSGPEDDAAITLAFSKKKIEERKEWLTNFMEDRRQRKLHGLPEEYLYGKNTDYLTYNDFINKELVLFSNSDNERSIPSLVDGLKPGQRKVLFTCFKRNDKREVKVAQLAGSVAEMSSYHHGEAALMMTIINLAQNFVGSNNLNLLQPIGQFGTRLHGGKDSASPRYIFTMLSPLARLVFPPMDDNILRFLYDDNQRVEPEWYMPIIPMVLVNGAEGIGTGWACKIPNFDIREVVNNIRRLMDGEEPLPMLPSYKNFKGTIDELGPNQYVISGEVSILDSTTIEITELPVRTWTQTYKEQVLEPMLNGTEKTPPLITDYKEYHTDTTVRFVVKMTEDKLAEAEAVGLHKVFKLQTSLTCNSMVLFDHVGFLKKYDSPQDILKEFFELRLRYYNLRKEWLIGMLGAESAKLSNQARFILEKIDGKIVIENKPKKELIQVLIQRGYESDPVKAWKEAQNKDEEEEEEEEESDKESAAASGPDFNYLLNMPLWYLTKEKKDELCKQRDNKEKELENLKRKSPSDLWKEDLAAFIEELDAVEAKEAQDERAGIAGKPLKVKGGKAKVKKAQLPEVMPSPHGIRVVPRITAEMKAEAEKKTKKKVKSEKTEFDENQDENTSGEKESSGLKQRLAQKPKTEQGAKRQATLPFKPLKKTKKRNPWSDSGSDSESDFEAPPQRERVVRQAAAKVKPMVISDSNHSSSDEESEFQGDSEGNSESDTNSKKKAPPKPRPAPKETTEKAAKAPKQKAVPSAVPVPVQDVTEDKVSQAPAALSVPVLSTKAVPKKPAAAKKAGATKDNQPSIVDILAKKKAAPKPKPAAKEGPLRAAGDNAKGRKVMKRQPSSLDSDSDSDFGSKPAKSVASKKSKLQDDTFTVDASADSPVAQPRARPGRLKKPVQYLEESSEDDIF
ncbi:PREDICTED: DNA topoisomerase 2-alpha [Corvus brachyrhynchos]|uniref:DNA topoisomerase 2-alpha n=1 Tax=Corvus brachyrhynchos TaxID=85066 RepID=UPI00081634CA|nr:PREDICTED: DNA topoisomerase 2-alpha [Corvus brachyrhynchos]